MRLHRARYRLKPGRWASAHFARILVERDVDRGKRDTAARRLEHVLAEIEVLDDLVTVPAGREPRVLPAEPHGCGRSIGHDGAIDDHVRCHHGVARGLDGRMT